MCHVLWEPALTRTGILLGWGFQGWLSGGLLLRHHPTPSKLIGSSLACVGHLSGSYLKLLLESGGFRVDCFFLLLAAPRLSSLRSFFMVNLVCF